MPRFTDAEIAELQRRGLCTECGNQPPLCAACVEQGYFWQAGGSRGARQLVG